MGFSFKEIRKKLRPYAKQKLWNKVFCIGAHKTGTTSLNILMYMLGFDCARQHEIEISTTEQVQRGNYRELFNQVALYDFFQDTPFALGSTYIALDAYFPNSKFIFTYRNPEEWFNSLIKYNQKILNKKVLDKSAIENFGYLREDYILKYTEYNFISEVDEKNNLEVNYNWNLLFNKDHYIKCYKQRRDEIIKYFQRRPNDLLIVDITKEKDTRKITNFLELPEFINLTFPRYNSTDNNNDSREIKILDPKLKEILTTKGLFE